jgi:hypothetical protein
VHCGVVFGILTVLMAKQKKKRNKAYTGAGASTARPTVTRMTAVNRSKPQQWWFEKKRFAKPTLIGVGIAIIVIWLLFELIRLLTGGIA